MELEYDENIVLYDQPDAMIFHKLENMLFHINEIKLRDLIAIIDSYFIEQKCTIKTIILNASMIYYTNYKLYAIIWLKYCNQFNNSCYSSHPFIDYIENAKCNDQSKNKYLNRTDEYIEQLNKSFHNDDLESFASITALTKNTKEFEYLVSDAAYYGSIKIFKFLLINGAPIQNAADSAIIGGNLEICELLKSKDISLSLLTSIKAHRDEITKWIIEEYGNTIHEPLINSIKSCNTLSFTYYFKSGYTDMTTLLVSNAVTNNNLAIVKIILDQKKESLSTHSPIALIALGNSNIPCTKYLLEKGFKLSHPKLMEIVINTGSTEVLQFIINELPDLFQNRDQIQQYISLAQNFGFPQIEQKLLQIIKSNCNF